MPGFQKGSRRGALITNCSTSDQLEFDRLVFRSVEHSISSSPTTTKNTFALILIPPTLADTFLFVNLMDCKNA